MASLRPTPGPGQSWTSPLPGHPRTRPEKDDADPRGRGGGGHIGCGRPARRARRSRRARTPGGEGSRRRSGPRVALRRGVLRGSPGGGEVSRDGHGARQGSPRRVAVQGVRAQVPPGGGVGRGERDRVRAAHRARRDGDFSVRNAAGGLDAVRGGGLRRAGVRHERGARRLLRGGRRGRAGERLGDRRGPRGAERVGPAPKTRPRESQPV